MLLGLGLKEEALTIPMEQLSGGEKMRAVFARILLEEPDLLILDEPTNHLDVPTTEWLEDFLKRFCGGVLVVSHDRYFLDRIATRIAELENGTITERSGNYSTFFEQKLRMREFAKKEELRLHQEIKRESAIVEQLRSNRNISAWKSRMKNVDRLKKELAVNLRDEKQHHHLYHKAAPAINFRNAKHISAEIAEARGFSKAFGNFELFRNVDFLILGGDKVGIIGPNGCGKTTLINILLGRDTDYQGFARLGKWVRYGFLGQEIDFINDEFSILEELLRTKEMTIEAARDYLAGFQFYGDELNKKIEVLSGGERVRLYMACLMLDRPDCLIMDEPTNHLDMVTRDALETALLKYSGTVIAISHDRFFLNRCITRIFEFTNRTINIFEGNYEYYRQQKNINTVLKQSENNKKGNMFKRPGKIPPVNPKEKKSNIREIETKIMDLERSKSEMEDSFGPDTPAEKYMAYDCIIREIESLYEMYAQNTISE
jgi:ATP-binding cassette subfamily F protein 3